MRAINARGGGEREKSGKVGTGGSSKSPSYQIRCERKQSWGWLCSVSAQAAAAGAGSRSGAGPPGCAPLLLRAFSRLRRAPPLLERVVGGFAITKRLPASCTQPSDLPPAPAAGGCCGEHRHTHPCLHLLASNAKPGNKTSHQVGH